MCETTFLCSFPVKNILAIIIKKGKAMDEDNEMYLRQIDGKSAQMVSWKQ